MDNEKEIMNEGYELKDIIQESMGISVKFYEIISEYKKNTLAKYLEKNNDEALANIVNGYINAISAINDKFMKSIHEWHKETKNGN